MLIAYAPRRDRAEAVKHPCAPGNRFIALSTFPKIHTIEQYAEDHGKLMKQVDNLEIQQLRCFVRKTRPSLYAIYVELADKNESFTTGNIHGAGGGKGQP